MQSYRVRGICRALPWLLAVGYGGESVAWGQNPAPPAQSTTQSPASQAQSAAQNQAASGQANRSIPNNYKQTPGRSHDRLFYAMPNFLTLEHAGNVPPLTPGEKFELVAKESFDPVDFLWYGLLAGIDQWADSPATYGQGWDAYGKRYGQEFGDGVIQNFMSKAIFPSLLHQDPRYYQMGSGHKTLHRLEYAISRFLLTRGDNGNPEFNYSEIFGSVTAAGISMSYYPASERSVGTVMRVWGTQIGYDTLTTVLKEFWPDLRDKLRKPKTGQTP